VSKVVTTGVKDICMLYYGGILATLAIHIYHSSRPGARNAGIFGENP
jgi:hypothetical protein